MASTSILVEMVKIYVNSTGSLPLQLGAAVQGFFGTDKLIDGTQYSYSVQQGSNIETGTGIYSASTGSLTRNVENSTNGNVAVSFGASVAVAITALARDLIPIGGTLPIIDALGDAKDKAISQHAATAALATKFDPSSIITWGATLTDVDGGEPPTGPCWYLDGTILKFNAGS